MKNSQRTDNQPGAAFETAHTAAVKANRAAGRDAELTKKLDHTRAQAAEMEQWLPAQQMLFFTGAFFIVSICEGIASWEFYKIFLEGHFDIGFFQLPHALFAAFSVVMAGVLISHSLKTLLSKQIADYELHLAQAAQPDTPKLAIKRQVIRQQTAHHILGLISLFLVCGLLIWFSEVRVFWEGKATGEETPFTALDYSPALFLILEVLLGIFFFCFLKKQALNFAIWSMVRHSNNLGDTCRQETQMVAAAVFELDQMGFNWQSNNEIRVAMLRYQNRNSSSPNYTSPIAPAHNSVFVRNKQGEAVSEARIIGITEHDASTNAALSDLNGVAILNYVDAEALKSITVNGQTFEGRYLSGTAVVLVIEPKRPIGF